MHKVTLIITLIIIALDSIALAAGKLPDTGQSNCYDTAGTGISCAGTGQDGAYTINPMSFADNGNGTVTDNNTGLVWQKCSIGQNNDALCSGTAQTYNWFQASGTYDANYNPASMSVCATLALGGSNGWRLPTKKELIGIVSFDIAQPGPMVSLDVFPNTVASNYWTSLKNNLYADTAWAEDFHSGLAGAYYMDGNYNVKCVSSGL